MPELSVAVASSALIGGIFMFLAPCTLPLIPAFLASLVSFDLRNNEQYKQILLIRTILFSIGFTVVFVCFGILTGIFGSALVMYKLILSQIGDVLIILFGLSILQILNFSFIQKFFSKIKRSQRVFKYHPTPLALGALFALGWTPCAGPILVSILFLAGGSGTALSGGFLLFIFSLGLAIPFLLVGFFFAHSLAILKLYKRYTILIRNFSGAFLIFMGIVLVFGHSIQMTAWGFAVYSYFGYTPMCTYF